MNREVKKHNRYIYYYNGEHVTKNDMVYRLGESYVCRRVVGEGFGSIAIADYRAAEAKLNGLIAKMRRDGLEYGKLNYVSREGSIKIEIKIDKDKR